MEICAECLEQNVPEYCDICNNFFCEECIEQHQHCLDCNGSGIKEWNVMRNPAGELDYLHGKLTDEIHSEACRRCERTGLRI